MVTGDWYRLRDVRRGRAAQDMARGSLETVAEAMRGAQRDLGDSVYKDVDKRWKALTIEVETTRMAASDLDKYHKARARAVGRDGCSRGLMSRWSPLVTAPGEVPQGARVRQGKMDAAVV